MKTELEIRNELDRLKTAHASINLKLYRMEIADGHPGIMYTQILQRYAAKIKTLKWVLNINEE